jgi:hypothetical protein
MTRKFALIFGIIYVLVGILGFIPGLSTHAPELDASHPVMVEMAHGRLLGLFPINAIHNIVHLAIGAWGIFGSRTYGGAKLFAQGLAVLYALLAILGLIPSEMTKTLFGLAPIHGYDIILHAGTALIAAYFGFIRNEAGDPTA